MKLRERAECFFNNYFLDYTPKNEKMTTAITIYYSCSIVFAIISGAFKITNQYIELIFYIITTISVCSYYFKVKSNYKHIRHWPKRKMTVKSFIILCSLRRITTLVSFGILEVLYMIRGYSDEIIQGSASDLGIDLATIIKVVIIGPIFEEVLIRGTGLILFDKDDNKIEAILLTSLVFGLMHANVAQSINATLGGLILGYIAIEYGIIFSILFHMINNSLVYVEYFFDIKQIIYIAPVTIIVIYILLNRDIFKRFINYFNTSKKFRFKRQLLHFFHPILLSYIFIWIIYIVKDVLDKG